MPRDRWTARSSTGDPPPAVRSAQAGLFRKEGEYWTVGYRGSSFCLRNVKGLGYLSHLLRHPASEFHVLDLWGGIPRQAEDEETSGSRIGLRSGCQELQKARCPMGWVGGAR